MLSGIWNESVSLIVEGVVKLAIPAYDDAEFLATANLHYPRAARIRQTGSAATHV